MDTSSSLGRAEMLRVVEAVAQEKGISTDEVLEAMEQAYQTAARRTYGAEHEIVAEIDRRTGEHRLYRVLEVADPVEDTTKQIGFEDAQTYNPAAQIGDHILDPLPPIELGRIADAVPHWERYLHFDSRGPWAEMARQRLSDARPGDAPEAMDT